MSKTIMIVENKEDTLDLMEYTFSKGGYDVITCVDTSSMRDIPDEEDISLILMDRNLTGAEGSVYISKLRDGGYSQPAIYISAKDSSEDIVDGFESGIDDYIAKPFGPNELKVRAKSMIRHTQKVQDAIKYKDITHKLSSKTFFIEDKEIKLTHLKHNLLLESMKNQNILLSRSILLERAWKDSTSKQPKTVNVAIKRLKKNIDPSGEKNYIQAVRGEGYTFC